MKALHSRLSKVSLIQDYSLTHLFQLWMTHYKETFMATYAELMAQIEKLQVEADKIRRDEKIAAIAQIKSLMTQHDITLNDLGDKIQKARQAAPIMPKYRDPKSAKTWSGRGHQPAWMKNYLAAGKNKDDFLIRD